jgi:hypothetical protein
MDSKGRSYSFVVPGSRCTAAFCTFSSRAFSSAVVMKVLRTECPKSSCGVVVRLARAARASASSPESPGASRTTAHPRLASRVGRLLFQTSQIRQIDIIYFGYTLDILWPIIYFGRSRHPERRPQERKRAKGRDTLLFGCKIINFETSSPAPNLQIQAVAANGDNEWLQQILSGTGASPG